MTRAKDSSKPNLDRITGGEIVGQRFLMSKPVVQENNLVTIVFDLFCVKMVLEAC